MNCERCGTLSEKLYSVSQENEYDGEIITKKVCWDCDHNVMNGGSLFDDSTEVLIDRAENNYAFDPINEPKPAWMP